LAVKVAFTISPGHGHLYPTLPLADALRHAGHSVAYVMIDAPPLPETARAHGHAVVAVPPTQAQQQARFGEAWADIASWDDDRVERDGLARLFVPLVEPALEQVVSFLRSWRADLVVHELTAFVGPLAAAIVDIPNVNHGTGFGFPPSALGAGEAMASAWRAHGLDPDPTAGVYRFLHLEVFPPSLPNPMLAVLDPRVVARIRPVALRGRTAGGAAGAEAGSHPAPPGRPVVLATLGTVFDDVESWQALDEAFARLDVEVVRLARDRFVPLGEVVSDADVVVAHGGAGTVLGALAAGKPLVLVPQGADQHEIAAACAAAGSAAVVGPEPESIAAAVERALSDPAMARAAAALGAEIAAMPSPTAVVARLEELAG
jgi:UDP:flavonoid glycosyltransferase YjiC (YdhE family)